MADSNDDLLEDGDLSESNYEELDLAEEDALLADDCDEKPGQVNHNEGEKSTQEDDDYLEMGIDEDFNLNDEEVVENGNTLEKKHVPIELGFNSHDNDDSDDNSGGERTRFKSERQITTTPTRNTSAIPETLDAVAVRNPVKFNKGGIRGGRGGRGGGGNNRKFGRNQPTNIHVNPHFRPRVPLGGPQMWNGGFQGQPQPPFQQQHPPYGYQPPFQQSQWNDQGYYPPSGGPPPYNQPHSDNYYGSPQEQFYQPMQPSYPPPPPPAPQMGWGDPNYYGGGPPHQGFMPPPPPFHQPPGPPMGPPRMRPPFNHGHRPPFIKHQNKQFNAKQHNQQGHPNTWVGGIRPQKREPFHHHPGKAPPAKQQKFDVNALHRVRSNLQEVKMVDCLPPDQLAEEEDEEMKAYRKKIEEQKKLREQLLKEKEEKRLVAAQQKLQESGVGTTAATATQGTTATTVTLGTTVTQPNSEGPPGVNVVNEYKMVRIRRADGKTVVKKMTMIEIQRLKKVPVASKASVIPPTGIPSRVVAVENLSASTTQKQLEQMASQVGPVEKVELDSDKNTALIKFSRLDSAKNFITKYQRKMVDLSMIGVKFIKEE